MQDAKNRRLSTIAQLCRAISSQLRYVSTIGKKFVKQQYLLRMSPQYGELGLLAAEIVSLVWGTPATFNGFRILALLLQRRCWTEANQTLHDVWPSPGLEHYIYIFGGYCPIMEFFRCKIHFASSKSCAILFWYRYCTALEQWARAKLRRCAQGATYIRQGDHHIGHWPTFELHLFFLFDC